MRIEVVTLFPELIQQALKFGVLGRAVERGIVSVGCEDPRAHTRDVHRTVDDRPYGGGPGMVLKPEPMSAAIDAATARQPAGSPRVYMSAQGVPFTQALAQEFSTLPGLTLVAGRYEGLDERVIESRIDREVSVGDYVLSGVSSRRSWSSTRWRGCCPGVLGRRTLERRGVVRQGFARLAALHAAGGVRRPDGARGTAGRAPR